MNQPNPYEFKFSADVSGAVARPVFNFLIKTLGPSFLACLLIVLIGDFKRMLQGSHDGALLYSLALVVFIPFFQAARCLRLPGPTVPSAPRAFVFGICAVAAFVGAVVGRTMVFKGPLSWEWVPNSLVALTISILLMLLRRIVFGRRKMFPLMIAIIPTSVITMNILDNARWLMQQMLPDQFSHNGIVVQTVLVCLYADIVFAASWLSDKYN